MLFRAQQQRAAISACEVTDGWQGVAQTCMLQTCNVPHSDSQGMRMAATGHVMINRVDKRSQLKCLGECRELLQKGASVLFFPEGTRSKDGRMAEFKKVPCGSCRVDTRTGCALHAKHLVSGHSCKVVHVCTPVMHGSLECMHGSPVTRQLEAGLPREGVCLHFAIVRHAYGG